MHVQKNIKPLHAVRNSWEHVTKPGESCIIVELFSSRASNAALGYVQPPTYRIQRGLSAS